MARQAFVYRQTDVRGWPLSLSWALLLMQVCASEGETLLLPLAASKLLEGPASDELLSVTQLAEAHWHKTKYRDNSRQGGN